MIEPLFHLLAFPLFHIRRPYFVRASAFKPNRFTRIPNRSEQKPNRFRRENCRFRGTRWKCRETEWMQVRGRAGAASAAGSGEQ
jgi:hypothetical protein